MDYKSPSFKLCNWIFCYWKRYVWNLSEKPAALSVHPWRGGSTQSTCPKRSYKKETSSFTQKDTPRRHKEQMATQTYQMKLIFIFYRESLLGWKWTIFLSLPAWNPGIILVLRLGGSFRDNIVPGADFQHIKSSSNGGHKCYKVLILKVRTLMMYHYNKIDIGSKLRRIRDPFVELHQLEQWANIMGWSFGINQLPMSKLFPSIHWLELQIPAFHPHKVHR